MIEQPLRECRDYGNFKKKKREKAMDINQRVDKVASIIIDDDANGKVAVSPPGWSGTVEHMKKHKDIDNPWALAWWMSKQQPGAKWGPGGKLTKKPEPHHKEKKRKKKSSSEIIAQVVNDIIIGDTIDELTTPAETVTSTKSYSTVDTVRSSDGNYVTIKTNYKEENGQVLLEEYVVEKNGVVEKFDNAGDFCNRLMVEGVL